jgi:hypothetical protein
LVARNVEKKKTRHIELDPELWNTYQIRLRQVNEIEWLGTVSMDGTEMCQMMMPALGPMEIQVWSDNYLVDTQCQRWWQIAPVLELDFQDGENKEFHLDDIRIF